VYESFQEMGFAQKKAEVSDCAGRERICLGID
jgi:hypothetical protein